MPIKSIFVFNQTLRTHLGPLEVFRPGQIPADGTQSIGDQHPDRHYVLEFRYLTTNYVLRLTLWDWRFLDIYNCHSDPLTCPAVERVLPNSAEPSLHLNALYVELHAMVAQRCCSSGGRGGAAEIAIRLGQLHALLQEITVCKYMQKFGRSFAINF